MKMHSLVNLTAVGTLSVLMALNAAACKTVAPAEREMAKTTEATRSSADLVKAMGVGINIGNTLDAFIDGAGKSPETSWGNPEITRELVEAFYAHGFRSVRVPVTWAQYIGPAPDYEVDSNRIDRVREVIGWCREAGLYAIVNLHHDGGHGSDPWILNANRDFPGTLDKFEKVWGQIAGALGGFDEGVMFEGMNEVGFDEVATDDAYRMLNAFNQTFVDTVRSSGGINASARHLLVAGYWTDIVKTCDRRFVIPDDPSGRVIVSVHYYTPATFAIADKTSAWGYRETWGTVEDYEELEGYFRTLNDRFSAEKVPVIVGEFGVTIADKDPASRALWLKAVANGALSRGACPIFWDTGNDISRHPPYAFADAEIESAFNSVFP